ncbi:MAG: YihY/virulence factor BrkB family protein [Candidatus Latescibacteria bacterium]|nr:YihY/virulence factor BrkB family protein [Candidatus Latescibacterota bacterium]
MGSPTLARISLDDLKKIFGYYLAGLYGRMAYQHFFLYSGGLAFSTIVCIVPFGFIILFALGAVLDPAVLDPTDLERQLALLIGLVCPERYIPFFQEMALVRIKEVVADRKIYGLFGIAGLLFSSSGLFSTMRTILNTIYQLPAKEGNSGSLRRDFGMVFLVLFAFLVFVTFFPALEALRSNARFSAHLGSLYSSGWVKHFLYPVFSFAFIAAVFFALYSLVPRQPLARQARMLSTLWAAVLWEATLQAFSYYLKHFASTQKVYGVYALIIGLILWIYCAALVFVMGAEIGQLYRKRNESPLPAKENPC